MINKLHLLLEHMGQPLKYMLFVHKGHASHNIYCWYSLKIYIVGCILEMHILSIVGTNGTRLSNFLLMVHVGCAYQKYLLFVHMSHVSYL